MHWRYHILQSHLVEAVLWKVALLSKVRRELFKVAVVALCNAHSLPNMEQRVYLRWGEGVAEGVYPRSGLRLYANSVCNNHAHSIVESDNILCL